MAPPAQPEVRPKAETPLTEKEILRRVKAGERELFYELVRPHQKSVFLTARSIVRNTEDAEEVAQEAILKAYRAIGGFRGDSKFSTWLTRITIHEARMRLRRNRLRTTASLDEPAGNLQEDSGDYTPLYLSDWQEVPSEVLERKEVRDEIALALDQLPVAYREVLILRDVENLSIAETAEALELTPGTVKIRLFRARLKMRDLLAPRLPGQLESSRSFWKGLNPWK